MCSWGTTFMKKCQIFSCGNLSFKLWSCDGRHKETMHVPARIAIFRQKNYSAEYETRRNRREFRRNSVCFAEEKNLGIPFRTISWKRKTIPFQTILNDKTLVCLSDPFSEEKTSEFRSKPFLEEKKTRNSIPNHFRKRKHLKIRSKQFLGTENTRKTMTFVSCFVKLHYFRGIPFRSVRFRTTKLILSMNTEFCRMSTFFRGITKTVLSLFCGICSERNFDGNPSARLWYCWHAPRFY